LLPSGKRFSPCLFGGSGTCLGVGREAYAWLLEGEEGCGEDDIDDWPDEFTP
jgi:hypothetical protein